MNLNSLLTKRQRTALKKLYSNDTAFLLYGGGAGGGKTWLGCFWLYSVCVAYPKSRWFIGRDSLKDTRESVLITWSKVSERYNFTGWKYGENEIQFDNGSVISFLDLSFYPVKDPFFERLGSKEYTGGWIEEAGEVKYDAFDVLKSRIGRHMNDKHKLSGKMLITANPKKGWLYNEFYKPKQTGTLPDGYEFIQALHTDNDKLPGAAVDSLHRITDVVKRQRLLMGDWDYDDDDNSLIPYNKIMDCFTNSFVEEGERYISSDVAITNDLFVNIVWSGLRIIEIVAIRNISKQIGSIVDEQVVTHTDFTPLLQEYDRMARVYKIPRSNIVYDADGIGHKLRTLLAGAVGLNNGSPAIHSGEYFNLKSELYYLFAEMVNSNEIYIQASLTTDMRDRLISEMQAIKRTSSEGEKLRIMPKSEVKQILGHSPDLTDAIVYRLLFWLTRKK